MGQDMITESTFTNPRDEWGAEDRQGWDKVRVANIVCQDETNLDILDLRERLAELPAMICKANGLKKA